MNFEKVKKRFIPMSETMLYILLSLRQERHGYGIMQYVKEITHERITLGAGTIYQTLGKLEKDSLISPTREEDRKKFYVMTELGEQVLVEEARRIKEIYENVEGLL